MMNSSTMISKLINEQWKDILFDTAYINNYKLQISNYGRVKSFAKNKQNGNLITGSKEQGYAIVRLKMYKEKNKKTGKQVLGQKQELDAAVLNNAGSKEIAALTKKYNKAKKEAERQRVVNIGLLNIIADRKERINRKPEHNKAYKLTVTKVILIKKDCCKTIYPCINRQSNLK